MAGESFILMGVSGSGKTLIGSKVAALLSAKFFVGYDPVSYTPLTLSTAS